MLKLKEIDAKLDYLLSLFRDGQLTIEDYQSQIDDILGNPNNTGLIQQIRAFLYESVPIGELTWSRLSGAEYHERKMDELLFVKRFDE